MDDVVSVIGVKDLDDSVQKLIKRYPDKAGECLKEEARRTRKRIVQNAKDELNTNAGNRMSLGKAGSYRISQVKGYGSGQYVEITARSPHYHLVERGHAMVLPYKFSYKNSQTGVRIKRTWKHGGESRGRVAGRFFLKKAREEEEVHFPEFVDKMVDDLLRESGF